MHRYQPELGSVSSSIHETRDVGPVSSMGLSFFICQVRKAGDKLKLKEIRCVLRSYSKLGKIVVGALISKSMWAVQ